MSETFTVIYEHGMLRPVAPLALPENARIQVRIVPASSESGLMRSDRQDVYKALMDAGLIKPQATQEPGDSISEPELLAAAKALGMAGPISNLIIAERGESY